MGHTEAKKQGFLFDEDADDGLLKEIFLERIYDVTGFIPKSNEVLIDIGAAYGETAVYWSKKYGALVWAFEPNPISYNIMLKHISLNKIEGKIFPFNIAIGDGRTIRYSKFGNLYTVSNGGIELKTERLDNFIFPRVDIIKIDVEGSEYVVLNGSLKIIKDFHPRIIIETHSKELREKCLNLLYGLNYRIIYHDRPRKGSSYWMNEVRNNFLSID